MHDPMTHDTTPTQKILTVATLAALAVSIAPAQLAVPNLEGALVVDFDSGFTGVNSGILTGSGIVADPSAGQLDSDAWRVTGLAAGDTTFGGDFTGASFTRGASTGGVTAGGMHAFDTAAVGTNWALGIQPAGNDFTPGSITLRVRNDTGSTVDQWDISYDLFVLNDQNRINSWNWAWSTNDTDYTEVDAYNSPRFQDSPAAWVNVSSPEAIAVSASVDDGDFFYLRWTSDFVFGSGGRDEFAIDNIAVTAVPEPSALPAIFGAGCLLGLLKRRV